MAHSHLQIKGRSREPAKGQRAGDSKEGKAGESEDIISQFMKGHREQMVGKLVGCGGVVVVSVKL